MQWWCSARTAAWTWSWQPYPGVWLFVALMAAGYLWLRRRSPSTGGSDHHADGASGAWFVLGLALLWISLDWPVGPLGASYLATVHMVQLLLISLLAPAFLLLGIPEPAFRALRPSSPAGRRALRFLTHPVTALLVFNGVVVGTHVPRVLDSLAATQAGMLLMDLAWLAAGLLFWWPVLAPVPRRGWFGPFFRMGYLFLNTIPVTLPYSFLVFADLPLYATFELAPPLPGISSLADQKVAGLTMKIGGGLILWTAITILFFRWYADERAGRPTPPRGRRRWP